MNEQKEILFCKNFVIKEKRERILYELQTPKKRKHALTLFSHKAEKIIKPSIIFAKSYCSNVLDIVCLIKKVSFSEQGYMITIDKKTDQKSFHLNQVVYLGIQTGMAFIVLIDESTALIREEQSFGAPLLFLLHKT